jgi:glycosyltransferase involved in cell wall biosynthesis
MKIALVMLSDTSGGIQLTMIPYALALMSGGHEVTCVVSQGSVLYERFEQEGLRLSPLMIPPLNWDLAELRIVELRRVLREFSPDLVIAFAGMGLPQVRRAIGHSVPVLSRCGDTSPAIAKPLLVADHLIATTDEMRQILVDLGAETSKVSVLPNFFSDPVVPHDYAPKRPLRIGSLGRLVMRKGFTDLIDALALLKTRGLEFEAVIAGEGRDSAHIKDHAAKSGSGVLILDWVDGDAKDAFLKSLDILVVPSRSEPFGNVLLEGMRYGLAMVTTATIGARAIFSGRKFLPFVDIRRPKQLAEAIASLAADPKRREDIGRIGQVLYKEEFTLATGTPRLLRLVDKVQASLKAKA